MKAERPVDPLIKFALVVRNDGSTLFEPEAIAHELATLLVNRYGIEASVTVVDDTKGRP